VDTYTIAQVEALTGIHAPTLRMWEKRYSFIQPHRTETNIRYYSGEQLKQLLNVSVLIEAGYKISKISQMDMEDLWEVSSKIQENAITDQAEIKSMIIAMMDMDEQKFEEIFNVSTIRRGLLETVTKLIYPFLHQVGILWNINKLMPAQEHLVSNIIRKKLFSAIDLTSQPAGGYKRSIVLFTPEEEEHEIALLLAYFILKNGGWRTYYLGTNVPLENILHVESQVAPDYFFTTLVIPNDNDPQAQYNRLNDHLNTPLLVTGNPKMMPENGHPHVMRSPDDLLIFMRKAK
jgi:DNA-binding transcriptional MerR regulator